MCNKYRMNTTELFTRRFDVPLSYFAFKDAAGTERAALACWIDDAAFWAADRPLYDLANAAVTAFKLDEQTITDRTILDSRKPRAARDGAGAMARWMYASKLFDLHGFVYYLDGTPRALPELPTVPVKPEVQKFLTEARLAAICERGGGFEFWRDKEAARAATLKRMNEPDRLKTLDANILKRAR